MLNVAVEAGENDCIDDRLLRTGSDIVCGELLALLGNAASSLLYDLCDMRGRKRSHT